jgi:outer membrane lipoprotein SlyB
VFAVTSVGSATGVYIVGTRGEQTGSFLATMGGAVAGAVVGMLGAIIIDAVSDGQNRDFMDRFDDALPIAFIVQAIGATIGFNLTRRYDPPLAGSKAAPSAIRDGLSVDLLRFGF